MFLLYPSLPIPDLPRCRAAEGLVGPHVVVKLKVITNLAFSLQRCLHLAKIDTFVLH